MAGQGIMKGVFNSWRVESPVEPSVDPPVEPSPVEPKPAVAAALLARFQLSRERGARHVADADVDVRDIDVKDIPALVRQERAEMGPADYDEAEVILAKSSGRRPLR